MEQCGDPLASEPGVVISHLVDPGTTDYTNYDALVAQAYAECRALAEFSAAEHVVAHPFH